MERANQPKYCSGRATPILSTSADLTVTSVMSSGGDAGMSG
mgnify:CR=1 FL=1